MTSWSVIIFRKFIKTVFVPLNRCCNYCNRKIIQIRSLFFFSTQGWFTPPTFFKTWQYRKLPVTCTRLNRYINITADELLSISCAIIILTDIITFWRSLRLVLLKLVLKRIYPKIKVENISERVWFCEKSWDPFLNRLKVSNYIPSLRNTIIVKPTWSAEIILLVKWCDIIILLWIPGTFFHWDEAMRRTREGVRDPLAEKSPKNRVSLQYWSGSPGNSQSYQASI